MPDRQRSLAQRVRERIEVVPDFPRAGVRFRDLTPILEREPEVFRLLIDAMIEPHRADPPDVVAMVESWGYLFGAPIALALGSRIALLRRAGRLPRATIGQEYAMGYEAGRRLEVHADVIRFGDRVLIVDDLLATGGTARAAIELVARPGAKITGLSVAVEIERLGGRAALAAKGIPLHAAVTI